MVFWHIKSLPNLLFGVLCLPGDQSHPVCATVDKPSCVLHLLGWFIGSRGFSSLERRPEFWVLQSFTIKIPQGTTYALFLFLSLPFSINIFQECLVDVQKFSPLCEITDLLLTIISLAQWELFISL